MTTCCSRPRQSVWRSAARFVRHRSRGAASGDAAPPRTRRRHERAPQTCGCARCSPTGTGARRCAVRRRAAGWRRRLPWLRGRVPTWRHRFMRSQWGSCSLSGRISLNTHLIKTPPRLIAYVALHELCHLQHYDHSRRFYALMQPLHAGLGRAPGGAGSVPARAAAGLNVSRTRRPWRSSAGAPSSRNSFPRRKPLLPVQGGSMRCSARVTVAVEGG
jgi:hypothetical protein